MTIFLYVLPRPNELVSIPFLDCQHLNIQIVTLGIVNLRKPAFIAMVNRDHSVCVGSLQVRLRFWSTLFSMIWFK